MKENEAQDLNRTIRRKFSRYFIKNLHNPSRLFFYFRMFRWQMRAHRIRKKWKKENLVIPTFMALSVTNRCNLNCIGCYANAQHRSTDREMSSYEIKQLISQAKELGVSFILLLGGEPFIRRDLLDITEEFPEMIFTINTNGLFINESIIKRLKEQINVFPLLSIEGLKEDTNHRRGNGVFEYLMKAMEMMRKEKILFGTNITITKRNFTNVFDEKFIKLLLEKGCTAVGFLEYLPLKIGTEDLQITNNQREVKSKFIKAFRDEFPDLFFIDLPGDEVYAGGCLSSGRGFVHVSAEGHLEPCVFFPLSDSNILDMPLAKALMSPMFKDLRRSNEEDRDTRRGCVMWRNRHLLQSSLNSTCSQSFLVGISQHNP